MHLDTWHEIKLTPFKLDESHAMCPPTINSFLNVDTSPSLFSCSHSQTLKSICATSSIKSSLFRSCAQLVDLVHSTSLLAASIAISINHDHKLLLLPGKLCASTSRFVKHLLLKESECTESLRY
ncbi:uncharacterized protein G2W53_034924 [Senna tora]|uniref:Uncharacterized protein n=1 Tax=Senna tora TaxID=362788 RepID=A0A834SRH1_9FABA|nr:uncharacterized protein G2W53_034924 [Senna tora]